MKYVRLLVIGGAILSTLGCGLVRPAHADVQEVKAAMIRHCGSLRGYDVGEVSEVIDSESAQAGFDPLYVLALIMIESNCNPTAVSRKGAVGLMQLEPRTAEHVARLETLSPQLKVRKSLRIPRHNVHLGTRYLRHLHDTRPAESALTGYLYGDATHRHTSRYARKVLLTYKTLTRESRWGSITSTSTKLPG